MKLKKISINPAEWKKAENALKNDGYKPNGGRTFEKYVATLFNAVRFNDSKSGHDLQATRTEKFNGCTDFFGRPAGQLVINNGDTLELKNNSVNYANFGNKGVGTSKTLAEAIEKYTNLCKAHNTALFAVMVNKSYFYLMDFEAFVFYVTHCGKELVSSSQGGTKKPAKVYKIDRASKFKKYAEANNLTEY